MTIRVEARERTIRERARGSGRTRTKRVVERREQGSVCSREKMWRVLSKPLRRRVWSWRRERFGKTQLFWSWLMCPS